MAPLGPAERVLVSENFLNSVHGQLACISCHGGNPNTPLTKEAKKDAHAAEADFVALPSEQFEVYCSACHSDITSKFKTSLHYTQNGYFERFKVRAGGQDLSTDSNMKAGFE